MADEMRAMLDQLMGKDRNVPLDQRVVRQTKFDDADVCKHALAGLCPFGLFSNTKSDLGPCEFEIHEGHLDWEAIKAGYDALDERQRERYGYERELLRLLHRLVGDMDHKIAKAKERAALDSQPKPLRAEQQAEVDGMRQQAKVLTERSEALAEAGDVDASMAAVGAAERLRADADKLVARYSAPDRFMEVCEVCGVFIQISDVTAARKQQEMDHLEGKQYLGWLAIREKHKELSAKYGSGGGFLAAYPPLGARAAPPASAPPAEEGEVVEDDRRGGGYRGSREGGGRRDDGYRRDDRRRSRSRSRGRDRYDDRERRHRDDDRRDGSRRYDDGSRRYDDGGSRRHTSDRGGAPPADYRRSGGR